MSTEQHKKKKKLNTSNQMKTKQHNPPEKKTNCSHKAENKIFNLDRLHIKYAELLHFKILYTTETLVTLYKTVQVCLMSDSS